MARKGVAGISGIGRTIENFQTSLVPGASGVVAGGGGVGCGGVGGAVADTKIYARQRGGVVNNETNENEAARKGKKRPNEDHDHPKTKLKHMVSFLA